ncbi:MAG: molybdopterin-dependent oxidoreductase [Ignavibacteriae bacterium]|nr:molybdopterin-dependent oxidoreductase [Ignavibacteriota bacterium]
MKPKQSIAGMISRREILKLSPLILLSGCDITPGEKTEPLLRTVQQFNDWVQSKVFDPDKLAPEYTDADVTPEEGFRVNGKDAGEPDIDVVNWSLTIEGLVSKPGTYTLGQIAHLPKRTMNTRHCCVEGWSMIPQWAGTPLREFLRFVGADPRAKYIEVRCADDYFTSYDMPSALHPQTLLCYEAYGKPLSISHGAPARIVMPVKLGYKSAKWVHTIILTNEKPGGYWEDQGYDWFAGL